MFLYQRQIHEYKKAFLSLLDLNRFQKFYKSKGILFLMFHHKKLYNDVLIYTKTQYIKETKIIKIEIITKFFKV